LPDGTARRQQERELIRVISKVLLHARNMNHSALATHRRAMINKYNQ